MKNSRVLHIALMEFKTILRLPVFWTLLLVTLLITMSFNPAGLIPSSQVANSGLKLFINSQHVMAQYFAFSGLLIFSFLGAIIAGLSIIRDEEAKATQIIHSTPLNSFEYIAGKFLGVMTALMLALVFQAFLAYVVYELKPLSDPLIVVGPFKLVNYVIPALLFGLPGVLFFAASAFAAGVWTRKPMVVYAVPAILFISIMRYCVVPTPEVLGPFRHTLLTYLDPSGLRWLIHSVFALDKGVEFYNTSPLILEPVFIINRALVIFVVLLLLVTSAVYLKRWLRKGGVSQPWFKLKRTRVKEEDVRPGLQPWVGLQSLEMESKKTNAWTGLFQMLRSELHELSRQPIFYLFALFILGLASESAIESGQGILGTSSYLTAGSIAVASLDVLSVLLCMLLLFYTIEVMQRDQIIGFASLLYTSPISTNVIVLARFLANAVLFAIVVALAIVSAFMLLAVQGPSFLEIWPFLLIWGVLLGITLMLWTSFVMMLLSIFRSRYTVYAMGILALGISTYCHVQGIMTWAFNWDLLGTLVWTDMGLFELDRDALVINRLWALSLALFFFVVAVHFFSRTERDAVKAAQRRQSKHVLLASLRLLPFALLPIILAGYTTFQVNHGFQGDISENRDKAYWSKNLMTWRDYQPANIAFVDAAIDLQPEHRSMSISGSYTLINNTDDNMQVLPFTVGQSFENMQWTVAGRLIEAENRSDLHLLHLETALTPGDSIEVGFSYHAIYPKGFTRNGGGMRHFILPSGVLISTMRGEFLPTPGFDERRGIFQENYYESVDYADELPHLKKKQLSVSGPSFQSRLRISAPSEYTVTATGIKTSEMNRGDTTTVVWETPEPVLVINVMAGKWDVRSEGNTAVYYHPAHDYNVDEILDALVAARSKYSEWFYPYPWQDLRINEFPNLDKNATGFSINISFSEGLGFLTKPEPGAFLPFVVTAHEAAHQWWGHILSPAEGPGADFLIEGMANYSTLLLLESEKGQEAREEFSRYMESQYVRSRRIDTEEPLSLNKAEGRQGESIAYNKGAWVMWMLQNEIGREQMIAGLQTYMERNALKDSALPDLSELIEIFRSSATDSMKFAQFEDQWFNGVVVPEFRLSKVRLSQRDTGWQVDAVIENAGTGVVEVEVAAVEFMPDLNKGEMTFSGQAAVEKIELLQGQAKPLTIITAFEPNGLMVDPHVRVLQVNRDKALFEF